VSKVNKKKVRSCPLPAITEYCKRPSSLSVFVLLY
jgi:hypothetical protein